jgi:hypothetical protein
LEIKLEDLIAKINEVYGYTNEEAGPLSILNHSYEIEVPHVSIDYIISNTRIGSDGLTRKIKCPNSNECYIISPQEEEYNSDEFLKTESATVRLWYFLIDDFEREFEQFSSSSDIKYFFKKGENYTKQELEDKMNEWWIELVAIFDSYPLLTDDQAMEICENCELSDDDIYGIDLNIMDLPDLTLESLNPNWSGDSFTIV